MNEVNKQMLEALKWTYAAICRVEGKQTEYRVIAPNKTIAMLKDAIAAGETCECDDKGKGQYHLPGCHLYLEPRRIGSLRGA